jgi:hypothetical protein
MGRPSKFSEKLFTDICVQIANGKGLVEICRAEGMPHRATVLRWLAGSEDLQKLYAQAHEQQADFYADQIIEIADEDVALVRLDRHYGKDKKLRNGTHTDGNYIEAVFDTAAVARNKLRIDARKWKAAKLAPKKWGEKVTTEHTGLDGGPMSMVTATVSREELAEIVRNVRDKF